MRATGYALFTKILLLAKQPAQRAGVVPLDVGDAPVGANPQELHHHLLGLTEIGEADGGLGLGAGFLDVDREVGDVPVLVADEGVAVERRLLAALFRRRL